MKACLSSLSIMAVTCCAVLPEVVQVARTVIGRHLPAECSFPEGLSVPSSPNAELLLGRIGKCLMALAVVRAARGGALRLGWGGRYPLSNAQASKAAGLTWLPVEKWEGVRGRVAIFGRSAARAVGGVGAGWRVGCRWRGSAWLGGGVLALGVVAAGVARFGSGDDGGLRGDVRGVRRVV